MPIALTRSAVSRIIPKRRAGRSGLLLGAASLAIILSGGTARAACVANANDEVFCTGDTAGYVAANFGETVTVAAGATVNADATSNVAIRYDSEGALTVNGSMLSATGNAIEAQSIMLINRGSIRAAQAAVRIQADEFSSQTQIENAGEIVGDVILQGASDDEYYQRLGATNQGNVDLGEGDDAFWLESRGDALAGGISGAIDGGDGEDIFGVRMNASANIAFAAMPAGFERYGVDLCGCDITATISAANYTNALTAIGEGTLINLANFTVTGDTPALQIDSRFDDDGDGDFALTFINRGNWSITNNGFAAIEAGVNGDPLGQFVNEGNIAMNGGFAIGMNVSTYGASFTNPGERGFVNRGTITADSSDLDAIAIFMQGHGSNSGSISATGAGNRAIHVSVGSDLLNEASGTITSNGSAVTLDSGASVHNSGTIISTDGYGVQVDPSFGFYGPNTIVNEAGGTITGASGAIVETGSSANGVNVANKGALVGGVDLSSGNAGDVFWAAQGSSVTGNVVMGDGDDLFIADIGRVDVDGNLDTSGIISGTLDTGAGNDTLMLQASQSVNANIIRSPIDGFEGGVVYEAHGENTVLTLDGPKNADGTAGTYNEAVRVAGNGTVFYRNDSNLGGKNGVALTVEDRSTSALFEDGGRLNLIIDANIAGGNSDVTIDAEAAGRVELTGDNVYLSSSQGTLLRTGEGTEVVMKRGAYLRLFGSNTTGLYNQIGIEAHGSHITNVAQIIEDGALSTPPLASNVSTGILLDGGSYHGVRLPEGFYGWINVLGTGIDASNGAEILNDGRIESHFGDAIHLNNARVVNGEKGLIFGHTKGHVVGTAGAAITGSNNDEVVENAGTIEGHILLGAGDDSYIAAGGTVKGDVDLGDGNDNFLIRDGKQAGVNGTITGGAGADAYGKSFAASGTFDLATNILPADFELHGLEARGAGTEVTVSSAATQTRGMRLFGNGKVINTASFDITGAPDQYGAIEVQALGGDSGALAFENRGTIKSNVAGVYANEGLASFTNTGAVSAGKQALYVESEQGFTFRNSGAMDSASDATVEIYGYGPGASLAPGDAVDFGNTGQIKQTGAGGEGVLIRAEGGTLKFANSGSIDSSGVLGTGADLDGDGQIVASNAGTIQANGAGGTGLALTSRMDGVTSLENCDDPEQAAQLAASFTNSGTIRANGGGKAEVGRIDFASAVAASVGGDLGIVRLTNEAGGVIEATGANSAAVIATGEGSGYGSVNIDASLRLFEMDNAGIVRGGADTVVPGGNVIAAGGDTDLRYMGSSGTERTVAGGIQTVNTTDKIRNLATGQIIGNVDLGTGDDVFENYGTLTGDLRLGDGDDSFIYAVTSTLTGIAYGGNGMDTLLVDLTGNGSVNFDQFRGFETLRQRGAGTVSIRGTTDMDTLTIAGSNITVAAGTRFDTQGDLALAGSDENETLTVGGTVGGSVDMGGGADVLTLNAGGLVEGNVQMGAGNDRVILAGGTVSGQIDGGDGTDTIGFQITGDTSALPDVINFESLDVDGNGRLTIAMNQDFDTVTLRNGADLTLNPGAGDHTIGNIVGDDSAQDVILNTQLTGGVSLGGGNDSLSMSLAGILSGALDGGAGNDTLNLTLTGASSINGGVNNFETINVAGSSPLTLGGTIGAGQTLNFDGWDNELIIDAGGSILGTANGGAGRDILTFNTLADQTSTLAAANVVNFEDVVSNGAGTLNITGNASYQTIAINGGDLTIGTGSAVTAGSTIFDGANNVLTLNTGATLAGPVDGGAGTDRLVLNQAANEVRQLGSVNFTGFEQLESGGPGELSIDTNASFETVDLLGAKMTIVSGATLTVPVLAGGAEANTLNVQGTLAGNVDLGGGDDRLIIGRLDAISGTRSGGAGSDTLDFRTAGSYATPVSWDGTGFDSFENLNVSGGVLSLTEDVDYQTVSVTGGRLIGQAGTTITSANAIVVSQGATFGTAGIVNGNIDVRGTLSPGASPGTMTVNGNVSFAAGSNLLLEVAPTGSDLLNISGTLTVAQGAAIDITGMLNATPGGALDLVVAQGGITGGFSTINKSATVFGFVATRGNKIQIVGEFSNNNAFGTNAQASIAYTNAVLGGGQMVQAFTGALPALVGTTGNSNAAAFAQLTPEAYGSAAQASIDNGLAITDSLRNLRFTAPTSTGLYGFAQGLSQWNKIKGNDVTGAAASKADSSGLIGGVGYGMEGGTRIGAFIGSVKTDQTLAALGASTKADGIVGGIFADTHVGGVGLHALIAYDGSEATTKRTVPSGNAIDARYDLGGWVADVSADYRFDLAGARLAPRVGVTYVAAKRDGVNESGNPFALAVEGGSSHAWFADAGLGLSFDTDMGITPYVEAGVRHMLNGNGTNVSGRFIATPAIGPVNVSGVARDRTVAKLSAGFGADLAKGVRLNVGYGAELGNTARHNLNGGITVSF